MSEDPSMEDRPLEAGVPQEATGPPRRRVQFSLRHVLVLFVLVSIALVLVVHLRQIGAALALYLAGMGAGWWFRSRRFFAASLTAILVFALTYAASWVQLGYSPTVDRHWFRTRADLLPVRVVLETYRKAKGEYPSSLQDLAILNDSQAKFFASDQFVDSWLRPYCYRKTASGYELASLGRDAKSGGVGLDADIFVDDQPFSAKTRLPWSQFSFETPGSGVLFVVALIASLMAGNIVRKAGAEFALSKSALVASVVFTTLAAVIVAVFLAAFHVAAVQSGH